MKHHYVYRWSEHKEGSSFLTGTAPYKSPVAQRRDMIVQRSPHEGAGSPDSGRVLVRDRAVLVDAFDSTEEAEEAAAILNQLLEVQEV